MVLQAVRCIVRAMTGGVAYVLDSDGTFAENLTPEGGVRIARLVEKNEEALKRLIRRHLKPVCARRTYRRSWLLPCRGARAAWRLEWLFAKFVTRSEICP